MISWITHPYECSFVYGHIYILLYIAIAIAIAIDGVVDCPLGLSPHHHNDTANRKLNKIITDVVSGAGLAAKRKTATAGHGVCIGHGHAVTFSLQM